MEALSRTTVVLYFVYYNSRVKRHVIQKTIFQKLLKNQYEYIIAITLLLQ